MEWGENHDTTVVKFQVVCLVIAFGKVSQNYGSHARDFKTTMLFMWNENVV